MDESPPPVTPPDAAAHRTASVVLDVVVPVYNEAHVLAASIATLHAYLLEHFPFSWRITVADNASTDGTLEVGRACAVQRRRVNVQGLDSQGRGVAHSVVMTS